MKQKMKRMIALFICALMLCSSFVVTAAEEEVKISDKEYLVSLSDANALFMSNDKPISGEVGSKMFLTYTVDKVTKHTTISSGVIGTKDNTQHYPYLKDGRLEYTAKSLFFDEGYTYVLRFENTEKGFEYECAKLKDDEATVFSFPSVAKQGATDYNYFGIWVDGNSKAGVSAILNHVRCYDEKGNDLGIHFNHATGAIQNEINELLDVHLKVDTSYDVTVKDALNVAIGNKYPAKTDVIYMEYVVADVVEDHTTQQGVILARDITINYPHSKAGLLKQKSGFKEGEPTPLLKEGAKYFICFKKEEKSYSATIQCTLNGETETFTFPYNYGKYSSDYQFAALWLGEGDAKVTASFTNFKCYDSKGNNLGVYGKGVTVTAVGEMEDYSKAQATYYCKENNNFIVLEDGKKGSMQVGDVKKEFTYKIWDKDALYLVYADGKETYEYTAMVITDAAQNKYERMKAYNVKFVDGEKTTKVKSDAANGYRVAEPEEPTKKGNKFLGWYVSEEESYDFNTVVTKPITLYAMWEQDGVAYLAVDQEEPANTMAIGITIAAANLLICAAACVVIVKRRKAAK